MNLLALLNQTLGTPGRMISSSKSGYLENNPNHVPVFNANVCTRQLGKFWFGDIDLTLDKTKLANLAIGLEQDVYVLSEMDARFEREETPAFEKAAVIFKPNGTWEVPNDSSYLHIINQENLSRKNEYH